MAVLTLTLHPGNVLAWLLVGLLAGAIAGRLTRGRGFGCIGDIVVGLIGSFIGGLIVAPFVKQTTTAGFLGTLLVALIGALVLLIGLRVLRSIV
ncbi:MAG TPA: GlsB/YeaQ/YmgE family stress response membrane protein [Chloroflexota bacterium]|nr:GlsB/YeaQ/YmgE family stress response membrane protein [Chloroflexota bacterium]